MAAKSFRRRALAFHSICLLISIIGCSYEHFYIKLKIFNTYGGRFKFLTHWSEYLHAVFFAFAVLVDIQESFDDDDKQAKKTSRTNNPKHEEDCYSFPQYLRDIVFVAICFPFGIMVVVLFWGITFIETEGLMTDETQKMIPLSSLYNHFLHTLPLFLNLAGLFLLPHKYPRRKVGISVVSILAVAYIAWLVHIGNYTGIWVYPFLQHQTMTEFVAFCTFAMAAAVGVYVFGEKLSSAIWKRDCTKDV